MGCNVSCLHLPCEYKEDWELYAPTGKSDDDFLKIIKTIEQKNLELKPELN